MKAYVSILFFCIISTAAAFADDGAGQAANMRDFKTDEEEARAYNVVYTTKTVDGLTFNVQEDRPIEKVAGVYRPLDIDSYVALKFAKMQEKVNQIEAALNDKIDRLAGRVDDLSKKVDQVISAQTALAANQAQGEGAEAK